MTNQKQLWQKGLALDTRIHRFTVGDDYIIDRILLPFDILGTAAHVRMLTDIGILTTAERDSVLDCLRSLSAAEQRGEISIAPEQEDCHTVIEQYVTEKLGDIGAKIHAGRSRNDQALLAVRLYLRSEVTAIGEELLQFAQMMLVRAKELMSVPMPGYTHFQPAMPSSVGMWMHAFAEHALSLSRDALAVLTLINLSPLGVGAGFGSTLPLDRQAVAKSLGFAAPQRGAIDVMNSRGRAELKCVRLCSDIASMIEKCAWDGIIYSSEEYGFFTLPREFTTGSSIMPQKQNPDVLELLRGKAAVVRGAEAELQGVMAKLPSNYHRDHQLTKSPTVRALQTSRENLSILQEVLSRLTVNPEAMQRRMTKELYSTYDAFREVREGTPFREAYRNAAKRVADGSTDKEKLRADFEIVLKTVEAERMEAERELLELRSKVEEWGRVGSSGQL